MTKRGGGITKQLPADYVIDWERFFGGLSTRVNLGDNVDTFITGALYGLPSQSVEAFRMQLAPASSAKAMANGSTMPSLPELTLKRGSRVRLPSGEEFAERFGYEPLPSRDIPARKSDAPFFNQEGFRGRTPLWYYILREAAVQAVLEPEPEAEGSNRIQKLGTDRRTDRGRSLLSALECGLQINHACRQGLAPTHLSDA